MKKENTDHVKKSREQKINLFMLNTKCSNKVIRFVNNKILNNYSTKVDKNDKCINKWEYFKFQKNIADDRLNNNFNKILTIRKIEASEVDNYPLREKSISLKKFPGGDINTIISQDNCYSPNNKNTLSINGVDSIDTCMSKNSFEKIRPVTSKPFINRSSKIIEKNTSQSSILSNVYTEQSKYQASIKNPKYYFTSPTQISNRQYNKFLITENSPPKKFKYSKNEDHKGMKRIERSKTFNHKNNSSIAFSNQSTTRNNSISTNVMLITKNSFNTLNPTPTPINTKYFETQNNHQMKNDKQIPNPKHTSKLISSKKFRPLSFSKTNVSTSRDDNEFFKSVTPSLPVSFQNISIHPENKILHLFKSLSEKENLSGVSSLNFKNKNVCGDIRSRMKNLKLELGKNSRKMKTIIDDLKRTQFNNDEYLKAYSSMLKVALLKKQKRDLYEEDAY